MEGNRHTSDEFEDRSSDGNFAISAQPYGTQTTLEQDRTELDEINHEGRADKNSSRKENGIGWQGRARTNTRNAENRSELMDDDEEED